MMGHFPPLYSDDTLEDVFARYTDRARSLRSAESAEFRTPQEASGNIPVNACRLPLQSMSHRFYRVKSRRAARHS
jgi:hypothetical protein